ncbi:MAG: hypothetical protein SFV19_10755 [Rhodospirillaceae bacterium]|nr:hypothetical protein [Rhodospirillaceae bacterium]
MRLIVIWAAVIIGASVSGTWAQDTRQVIDDPCLKDRKTCPEFKQVPAATPPPRQEVVDPCLKNRETCPEVRTVEPPKVNPQNPPVVRPPPRPPIYTGSDGRRISYGGPQTITCFQGGGLMFQHVGVTSVRATWTRNYVDLSFKLNGVRRKLLVNLNGATCVIEDTGKETVAIYEQY